MNDTPAPHPDARAEALRLFPENFDKGKWDGIISTDEVETRMFIQRRAFQWGAEWAEEQRAALLAERPAPTPEDREALADLLKRGFGTSGDAESWEDAADALIAAGVTFR